MWEEVDRADAVVHAGDWCDLGSLAALQERAERLIGVHGNNDGPELRERLPEVVRAELGGVRFAVVHETGWAQGRAKRCARPTRTWTCWSSATSTSPGGTRADTAFALIDRVDGRGGTDLYGPVPARVRIRG